MRYVALIWWVLGLYIIFRDFNTELKKVILKLKNNQYFKVNYIELNLFNNLILIFY